ncbi:hypothetical protein JCM10003_3566 [Bacteroides pyogenes JCM 10003]|nr:hypothetical protein JCM10003_3566 [Bacteroides pyogenes JCM 10003]
MYAESGSLPAVPLLSLRRPRFTEAGLGFINAGFLVFRCRLVVLSLLRLRFTEAGLGFINAGFLVFRCRLAVLSLRRLYVVKRFGSFIATGLSTVRNRAFVRSKRSFHPVGTKLSFPCDRVSVSPQRKKGDAGTLSASSWQCDVFARRSRGLPCDCEPENTPAELLLRQFPVLVH